MTHTKATIDSEGVMHNGELRVIVGSGYSAPLIPETALMCSHLAKVSSSRR